MALRAGIAGYGLAGRFFHAPMLKASDFEVAGVLTNNPERAKEARDDFPQTKIVRDIQELIDLKPDILIIATANKVHAEQAIAGLKLEFQL